MAPDGIAGTATRRLLEDQIADERERRESLESRGAGVITTGGVIVSLVVGVAAAFTDPSKVDVPHVSLVLTYVALTSLLVAAVLAIAVVLPTKYQGVDPMSFVRLLEEHWWNAPLGPTDRRTAEAQLSVLISTRRANRDKAILLSFALGAEAIAVVLLGFASLLVLSER